MTRFSALLDTNVLVPVALADTLLRLAESGLLRPLWSDRIEAELVRTLARVHPALGEAAVQRRVDAMNSAFIDARVGGWAALVESLDLPDPNDRHVLAAAVCGRADVIVTNNVKDFPSDVLAGFGLEAQTADTFLLNQLDLAPNVVLRCLKEQGDSKGKPPLTLVEVIAALRRAGVADFADAAESQHWRASRW